MIFFIFIITEIYFNIALYLIIISIISISTYGVFMIGPAIMGYIAKYLGINYVFFPMIILFLMCLLIVVLFKKKFIV